jgi:hypothetical protein
VKNLSGAPLYGKFLALPTNTRLGWKGLPGTNTLAYYRNSLITTVISFMIRAPEMKNMNEVFNLNLFFLNSDLENIN